MSLSPSHQTSSTAVGAVTLLILVCCAFPTTANVRLIDFETIPPFPATVDSFSNQFPGLTLAGDRWIADEVNNSVFENIQGRSITTLSAAPLTVSFDLAARDIMMDLGSGTLGMSLTIDIAGYLGGQPVFFDSFITHPVTGGADEVRARTFGIVDRIVVNRTTGDSSLTLDNLSFAVVPEPATASLVLAAGLVVLLRFAPLRDFLKNSVPNSHLRSDCAHENDQFDRTATGMGDTP